MVKNQPANAGDARDVGLITGLRRSPGGGNGNLLQYPCLENSMERSLVGYSEVIKSWTRLTAHTHACCRCKVVSCNFACP